MSGALGLSCKVMFMEGHFPLVQTLYDQLRALIIIKLNTFSNLFS